MVAIFPEYKHLSSIIVDLDKEARIWSLAHPELFSNVAQNPLLDPEVCEHMVADTHRRLNVSWSYGGYLEDRSFLWRDSYLEQTLSFLHLGVDFNVPAGTRVAATFEAIVLRMDEDSDEDLGWGRRIFLEPVQDRDIVLLYAHMDGFRFSEGCRLPAGATIGEVADSTRNGGWYPHLHVQAIQREHFDHFLATNIWQFDGYAPQRDIETLRLKFPDPLRFL